MCPSKYVQTQNCVVKGQTETAKANYPHDEAVFQLQHAFLN